MAKVKVLLDTNFLLTMVRHKIHGFEEIKEKIPAEFYVLGRVIYELEGLSKTDKKIQNEAKLVKQVLANNSVKEIDSTTTDVDTELVKYSKEGYVIATNDKILRQRIKAEGGKSIFIRSLTYIDTGEVVGE